MAKPVDLVGQKFDMLTVTKKAEKDGRYIVWYCNCECGTVDFIVRGSDLKNKRVKSCGCKTVEDIDEEKAKLIASYKEKCDVWVELGLQTANDRTAEIINRGYYRDTFGKAMDILKKYGIHVVVHLIVGLPGEGIEEIMQTVEYINGFDLFGVKIHSIYVMRGTQLEKMYNRGEYTPPSIEEYTEAAVYILTHIDPEITVHRLTGDCPRDMLVAPDWNRSKNEIINIIVNKMQSRGLSQGCEH